MFDSNESHCSKMEMFLDKQYFDNDFNLSLNPFNLATFQISYLREGSELFM